MSKIEGIESLREKACELERRVKFLEDVVFGRMASTSDGGWQIVDADGKVLLRCSVKVKEVTHV